MSDAVNTVILYSIYSIYILYILCLSISLVTNAFSSNLYMQKHKPLFETPISDPVSAAKYRVIFKLLFLSKVSEIKTFLISQNNEYYN